MFTSPGKKTTVYPWRSGNTFTLLNDGVNFFPAMLDAIDHAKRHVLVELYLVRSGRIVTDFVAAFCAAARRGVRVQLLFDGYGASGLSRHDRHTLQRAGVTLTFYNPLQFSQPYRWLLRDHRKIIVIDDDVAFVGGMGFTDDFIVNTSNIPPWRECVVAVKGENVRDWHHAFNLAWQMAAAPADIIPARPAAPRASQRGRVVLSDALGRREIRRTTVLEIRSAQQRIWIATAYFLPSRKIRQALRRAAQRGVDVRLLLPGKWADHPAVRRAGHRFYARLLHAGIRIFEYQPRFLHAKVVLCDEWVSLGSSNIDRWNFRWNLEANQEVRDPAFCADIVTTFTSDFTEASEIHFHEWSQRSRYGRIQEWLWGKMDRLLDRLKPMRARTKQRPEQH